MIEAVSFADLGAAVWDAACSQPDGDGWFWQTSRWMEYSRAYRPELGSKDASFALVDSGEVVALVQAFLETHGDHVELSFGGDAAWAPVIPGRAPRVRAAAWKAVMEATDELARTAGASRAAFRVSPLIDSFATYLPEFLAWTSRFGYQDVSGATQVIDLDLSEASLRTGMTKGHRAAITQGRRDLEVVTLEPGQGSHQAFTAYRAAHAAAAGRITRPAVTFDLMEAWLGEGHGLLVGARGGLGWAGFSYVLVHGTGAYYASGANAAWAASMPVGHVLQGEVIRHLKHLGILRYEVGAQAGATTPHLPASDKERNISRFKRGFGGRLAPMVVREKFYSADLYRAVRAERDAPYIANLKGAGE